MFCPVCRLEYRPGFTKCSDCDATLVEQLPDEADSAASGLPADPEAMEVLWAGQNSRDFDTVCSALDAAKIRYQVRPLKLVLIAAAEASEILVRAADYDAARKIVQDEMDDPSSEERPTGAELMKDAEGADPYRTVWQPGARPGAWAADEPFSRAAPFDPVVPSWNEEKKSAKEATPNDIVEDFEPAEATRVVWSGKDAQLRDDIQTCLDNVGVGTAKNDVNDGTLRILVNPKDETRAKEVVREIVDQTPME